MKKPKNLLIDLAPWLVILLILSGCLPQGKGDEAVAQSVAVPTKSIEPDTTAIDTILGQVISIEPRENKTDPFVIRLKYYLDKVGSDSTLTLVVPAAMVKKKIESYDYYLVAFQTIGKENIVRELQILNLRQQKLEIKQITFTLWLYKHNGKQYVARVINE